VKKSKVWEMFLFSIVPLKMSVKDENMLLILLTLLLKLTDVHFYEK
jgi:hypothetical protein